ncbi:oxidoreductase [Priestia aryabhattai]|uniref:aldo/keto reductase n=1 Tax=Bacillaceae TaxID=186817 RepID=UPI000BA07B01|nr:MULTISPECIES: aldo/keto reductase [Bacillaceae]MDT2045576.1 aldo/keto reductase [Priestia flexa]OZT13373.1 oxidoreductase [Priestia aryabhattai]TDB50681.1 aldo/keto reductase [Bacillus sp. CBEL-1]USY54375.1 aldo/keto reductase [Bacillus sp. 1780r2a1]
MKKRQLGSSNLLVSEVSLGCMSLGTDMKNAERIIDEAVDLGINYFDTADLYDFGINEEIVGQALQHKRQDIILATKVGNRWNDVEDGWRWDPSKAYIKDAVKESLHRLKTDYIDLYQLHGGTIEDNIDETIETFEELKKEGLIREYGISSIRPNVIREFVKKSSIVSVMMQYSLLDRRPEESVLPLLNEHTISVVARGPVAKGLLTNQAYQKLSLNNSGYLTYTKKDLEQLIPALQTVEPDLNHAALSYCLYHPAVASVVAGASSPAQLRENVQAVEKLPLSELHYEKLQSLTQANKYEAHR